MPVSDEQIRAWGLNPSPRRIPIPDGPQDVATVLDRAVELTPDAEALIGRHARYTFAELDREVNAGAAALRSMGLKEGDRIAASTFNHTDIVVAFLAAQRLGAIWVGINRPLAPPEKKYLLSDAGVSFFLGDKEMSAQIGAISSQLPALKQIIAMEPGEKDSVWRRLLDEHMGAERPDVEIDPWAPAAIAYTSGTTGKPKGAVHSQHNIVLVGAVQRHKEKLGPDLVRAVVLPLTILNLMILGPVAAAQDGAPCVCMDKTDPVGIAEWVRTERIGTFATVPAVYYDLLTSPEVDPDDLMTLVIPGIGGADVPESFAELFRKRFKQEMQNGYGLTEAPTSVSRTPAQRPSPPRSCGFPHPQFDIRIFDENGRELPADEVGEICVSAAKDGHWAGVYTPMLGYWKRPEATADTLKDGWLHTGDMGCFDAEGFLYVKDRRKDVIIRGGANVYPAEIESVLHKDERVAACAVLGKPDPRLGEIVIAIVEPAKGIDAGPELGESLRQYCLSELARYKVPVEWHFIKKMPRNPMNKIVKPELRKQFVAEAGS